ncbi:MAG: zinc-binding dehydrogenase [Anaerolineae bacterium]|nr:zinc-binding dehydrogenase [Anaerolineae bacterium]
MTTAIPKMMKALQLNNFDGTAALELVEKPVPQPQAGEVLIKISAASVNPSDLAFLNGDYKSQKKPPIVAGFEGSGEVVAVGAGLLGRYLLGKRVACVAADGDGTWAQYMITKSNLCLPLQKQITDEQGAALLINPFTAYVLVSLAEKAHAKALVQTAAASQVGRMVERLCQHKELPVINIVRRDEQAQLLRDMGARHILNSSADGFEGQLSSLCQQLQASYAFCAVGGRVTGQILKALIDGGTVNIYGLLSEELPVIDTLQLLFNGKQMIGFWLPVWFAQQNILTLLRIGFKVQKLLSSTLASTIQGRYALPQAIEAIKHYAANMTEGKVLITPN